MVVVCGTDGSEARVRKLGEKNVEKNTPKGTWLTVHVAHKKRERERERTDTNERNTLDVCVCVYVCVENRNTTAMRLLLTRG